MKILKYIKGKNNIYKIYLDNNEIIELYDEIILKNNLLLKKEIKNDELAKLLQENSYYVAYFSSLKYLNKKMHSIKETKNYLIKNYDLKVVNEIIDKLIKECYLNDELYVKAYINDQINLTNKGYYKILKELYNLDIDEDLIKKYLNKIKENVWEQRIDEIVNKKIKSNHKYSGKKLRDKLIYDLVSMGYQKDLTIFNVYGRYMQKDDSILIKKYNLLLTKLSRKYQGKDLERNIIMKLISEGFEYEDIKR